MQIDAPTGQPATIRAPDTVQGRTPAPAGAENLRAVAQDLEAAFLAEMLKHSGLGAGSESFGGGVGEDQFASFLTQEHARLLAERGGIGLAENIYRALVARAES